MGCEYQILLDEDFTLSHLEKTLQKLPNFAGKVDYPQDIAFEFRTKENLSGMPDLYVIKKEREITICQQGDPDILRQVLGTLVSEYTSESQSEKIIVKKL